jgi:replicative DNA helicase
LLPLVEEVGDEGEDAGEFGGPVPCMFVSLESSTLKLGYRLISQRSGMEGSKIMRDKPTKDDVVRLSTAAGELIEPGSIFMKKIHAPRHHDVTSAIRTAVKRHGVKMVVIDYLQLIKASSGNEQHDMRMWDRVYQRAGELQKSMGMAV